MIDAFGQLLQSFYDMSDSPSDKVVAEITVTPEYFRKAFKVIDEWLRKYDMSQYETAMSVPWVIRLSLPNGTIILKQFRT